MERMGKKITQRINKHPWLAFIVIIQLVFILALSFKACITPRNIVSLKMNEFNVDGQNAYIEDDTVKFVNDGSISDDNRLDISKDNIGLPSGGYTVNVSYDSMVNEDRINENNANVSISSRWGISFDAITLDDQNNIMSGKLWIPFFSDCDDMTLTISYNGNGTLDVSDVTFTESLRYRLMRILGFIVLFSVADVFIMIFFSDIKVKLKWNQGILLLIVIAASIPFFAKSLFGGHDLWFHVLRIVSVAEELQNGQFPVRMATELNNGYGYPTSIYYCDIFLYPVAILYLMFVPLRLCYQIYAIMINAATTIFTYVSIGKITKKEHLRLIGTGLYVLCIYRLVNVNVRAAAGEYTAMTFLPLIVAGMYMIYTSEKPTYKEWLFLTFGMAGVIMSHVLTGEMIVINLVLLCLILIRKTLKKDVIFSFVKAALLCIGITAWFLIPFFDYFRNQVTVVQTSDLRLLETTTNEFIYIFQLFAPGKDVGHYLTLGMPLIFGLGILLWYLAKFKKDEKTQQETVLRVLSGFAIMNILFVSKLFPWNRIQKHLGIEGLGYQIGTIQFSWRFIGIASVILAFVIVLVLNLLENKKFQYARVLELSLVACIFISVGFFYYKFTDEVWTGSYNMVQSYSGSDNLYLLDGTDSSVQNKATSEIISGDISLIGDGNNCGNYSVYVENGDTDAVISVPIYGYRYYKAYDDRGNQLETNLTGKNCIAVEIPSNYEGNVTVKFVSPVSWRIAEWVSLICLIAIIVGLIWNQRNKVVVSNEYYVKQETLA